MASPARSRIVAAELPGRVEAEADLRARFRSSARSVAVVVSVDRLELLERRLGAEASGRAQALVLDRLALLMTGRDRCYRWSGAAFLLLMDRTEPLARVAADVRLALDPLPPLELEHSAGRLSCSSSAFVVDDAPSALALVRRMELFLGTVHTG